MDYYFSQKITEGMILLIGNNSYEKRIEYIIDYYHYACENAREVPNTEVINKIRNEFEMGIEKYKKSNKELTDTNLSDLFLSLYDETEKWYNSRELINIGNEVRLKGSQITMAIKEINDEKETVICQYEKNGSIEEKEIPFDSLISTNES